MKLMNINEVMIIALRVLFIPFFFVLSDLLNVYILPHSISVVYVVVCVQICKHEKKNPKNLNIRLWYVHTMSYFVQSGY